MTAIVGIAQDGKVWMGADSAGSSDSGTLSIRKDPKLFVLDEMLFGVAGSFRVRDVLEYFFHLPKQQKEISDSLFMHTKFISALKATCEREGILLKDEDDEEVVSADILIGYRGNLYTVFNDLQVCTTEDNFHAVGGAASICVGSLYTSRNETNVEKRIIDSLQAAERYNTSVRAPFIIKTI